MKRFLLFMNCFFSLTAWSQDAPRSETMIVMRCGATPSPGNQPLYVVDGIPVDKEKFQALDPVILERIDILRDSAASLLGCRRNNHGVIVVTTRPLKDIRIKVIDDADSSRLKAATAILTQGERREVLISNEAGEIILPKVRWNQSYKVSVTSIGYTQASKKITFSKDSTHEVISLKKDYKQMEAVVIKGQSSVGCVLRHFHFQVCRNKIIDNNDEQAKSLYQEKPAFALYPNPVARTHSITILPKQKIEGTYQLLTVSGQIVQSGRVNNNPEQPLRLTLSSTTAGVYFVRLTDQASGQQLTEKIIVQ